jgi:hypothetical protein
VKIVEWATAISDVPAWTRTLVSAIAGAALATAYFSGFEVGPTNAFWLGLVVLVTLGFASFASFGVGRRLVERNVRLSVSLMGMWVWFEMVLAATGVAAAVWIAATLVPAQANPDPATKAVVASWAAALTAGVTAFLVKRSESAEASVGARIRAVIRAQFANTFPSDSPAWNAVNSPQYRGIDGWGRKAAQRRAQLIYEAVGGGSEVADGNSVTGNPE